MSVSASTHGSSPSRPVDDPKIAISVLVENAGFGATNAAPIARKVLDTYLLGPDAAAPNKPAPPKQGG